MNDAKEMWEAIKSRFGGNDESKKMQKYILKQQFEGFSVSNSEGLHKGYDRFQSLLSQLEIHGAGVSTEDANQKFLRSLPSAWSQVSLIMRTKPGVDSLSFDDLYNNLRVFESDVKGSTASSSSTQNMAFVSENTSSTNDVSTAYGVSNSSGHNSQYEHTSSYSLLANQSSCPQLDHEDLEQLDEQGIFARSADPRESRIVEERYLDIRNKDKENRRRSVFKLRHKRTSETENSPVNDRYAEGMHVVPPPITGIYIPSGPDKEIDDSKFTYVKKHMNLSLNQLSMNPKYSAVKGKRALQNKGIVDSGCSRHMTGNKAYLAEYQDFNGGPVAFGDTEDLLLQAGAAKASSTNIVNTASTPVSTASPYGGLSFTDLTNIDQDDSEIPALEEIYNNPTDGIFTNASYDDEGAVADFTNLETIMNVSPIPTSRINSIHPLTQILGDPKSAVQTRSKVTKSSGAHAFDKYVAKILKKFDFASVKTASTPIETQKPLVKDEEASDVDVHLYRSMIGSLMYLTASRPDIMFVVCACSRFQVTPKTSYLSAVKRIFRYLKGKPKLGLWYPRVSSFDLEAYSDSDYAGANLDRKSTTGGCQFLGRRLISWQCKKQTIVATSTTEAEYVVAANCCGQVLWIQNQMLDYGFHFMNTKIYIDKESTICIVKNPIFHSKTKHIAIRHHFIRDAYEKKLIQVLKIHTDDNVADLLTKAFDVSRHLDATKKFVMYPRFISIFLSNQLTNVLVPLGHFPIHALSNKVFSFMVKKGKHFSKHFSGKVTPLFATMLVQPTQDEGAPSDRPSEAQPTPSPAPTSEVPNEPQTDSSPAQTSEVPIEQQTDLSPRPSPTTIIPDSIPETSGGNLGGHSSSDKSLSGNEGEMTLQSVYDLCLSLCAHVSDQAKEIQHLKAHIKKQAKPVIYQHRAWLKSVSSKQRLTRKWGLPQETQGAQRVSDHMQIENAQDVGRTREIVDEEKELDEDILSTEDVLSTDKEKVSTDRPIVSTDGSKVSTDKQVEGTDEQNEGTEEQIESTDGQRKGTEDHTKEGSATQATQTPTSTIFGDDEIIAKVLLNMSQAKAVSREKEKGIDPKDKGKKKIEEEDESESESDGIPEAEKKFKQLKMIKRWLGNTTRRGGRQIGLLVEVQEQEREQFTLEESKGRLMVMFNRDEDEFWNSQHDWNIVSWKLHGSSGVHTLVNEAGLVIHMLVKKKYPLIKKVMVQMLKLKLESKEDSTMALELIRFIKKLLAELEPEE
ncbi:hypothetical protein Tco_0575992 [Tanacetum coccineum]